ncbi:MAG: NifB/NifX family molybdenum-iron cluster-binding protein [Ethanoligenens sp.]
MKIAITTDGDKVFQHFGQCRTFTLFEIEDGSIIGKELIDASQHGHAALADFLTNSGVNVVICGGIGEGARRMLAAVGIELLSGMDGNIEEIVKAYLSGKLTDQGGSCSHTDHDHDHACSCENHCN